MKMLTTAALAAVLLTSVFSSASAEEKKPERVPTPDYKINTDKGDKCVEPEDVILRNHMKFLLHHRDKTMHQGIRTTKYSLKNCVNCHADPKTGSVLGKQGFCESCHTYASVKIDCFECHSSMRQESAAAEGTTTPAAASARALNSAHPMAKLAEGKHP